MSLSEITFSCVKCRSSLISRKMRLASIRSSNARGTFLIATFSPVLLSLAELPLGKTHMRARSAIGQVR